MRKAILTAKHLIVFLIFAAVPGFSINSLVVPTQTSKFIVLSYLISALIIVYAILFNFTEEKKIDIKTPDLLLISFFIYVILDRYWAGKIAVYSLRFDELLTLGVIYTIIRWESSSIYQIAFFGMVAGVFGQIFVGILQYYGWSVSNNSNFPVTGTFFNPGPYAGYIASGFPVVFGAYCSRKWYTKYVYRFIVNDSSVTWSKDNAKLLFKVIESFLIIVLIFIVLVVTMTGSRAAVGAIVVCTVYLLLKYYLKSIIHIIKLKKRQSGIIALVLFVIILMAGWTGYIKKKDSADGRLFIWKIASELIYSKPLIGLGYDNFQANYMNSQAKYFSKIRYENEIRNADDIIYPFNEPLQFAIENGIIISLIILACYVLIFNYTKDSPETAISKAGIITVIIFSLFSYPSQILPIKMNLVVYLAVSCRLNKNNLFLFKLNYGNSWRGLRVIYSTATFTILMVTWSYLSQLTIALQYWNIGSICSQSENYETSVLYYKKALPVVGDDGSFLTQYGMALSKNGQYRQSQTVLLKASQCYNNSVVQLTLGHDYQELGEYNLAEQAYKMAWFMIPNRIYPLYMLAKLYDDTGQKAKAVAMAHAILGKKLKINNKASEEIFFNVKKILIKNS